MCLIVAKPKGQRMPSKKNMKRWFADNPDGVGISFQYHGKVRTIKGAMTIEEMFQLVNKMNSIIKSEGKQIEDIDLLIQFRRAVTGRVCPEFCHPFPVSPHQKELDSLDVISELAFAHNGIIWEYTHTKTWKSGQWYGTGEDINDAQEFIKDYIVGMGMAVHNKSVQELIISYTDSKFAILSAKGIDYIGFYYKEKGLLFSNDGYKPRKPIVQSKYPLTTTYLTHGARPSTYGSALWEGEDYDGDGSGCHCDFCDQYAPMLYYLPNDNESNVCQACYMTLEGKMPLEEDRAF